MVRIRFVQILLVFAHFTGFFYGFQANSYQLSCDSIFSGAADYPRSDSASRLLKVIGQYKKIIGIEGELLHKPKNLDEVKIGFNKLDEKGKKAILRLIADNYNELKALKYNKEGPFKTFKRHLDTIVSIELNAAVFFKESIYENHLSLEETLSNYFKKVQKITNSPLLLEGEDVILTAIRLQEKYLSSKNMTDESIILYGSFVNGRAFLKSSDLDFAVDNPMLEVEMREDDTLGLLQDFPFSEAQAHTIAMADSHNLGFLNPLVLIIKKDFIVLRVYENKLSGDFSAKKVKFYEFYF